MAATNVEHPELLDDCEEFLRTYSKQDILTLAEHYPREQTSITVDWMDLFQYNPELAEDYVTHPQEIQDYLDAALKHVPIPVDITFDQATVRVVNVNGTDSLNVGQQRATHIGQYHAITGQVAKTSKVKPRAKELHYVCVRCGSITPVPQRTSERQEPGECRGCERNGPFSIDFEKSELVDYQQIRLQQPPEETKGGEGDTIDVEVEGDLVATVTPGDRVEMNGILDVYEDSDNAVFTPYVEGRGVQIEETDYEEISIGPYKDEIESIASGERGDPYELLRDSLAPKIRGYPEIKEAIMLQLFGGNRVEYPDGSIDRGDSHILLLGDPGTAKSSLLRAVEELAPRSVYASGKGLSAAGATAAAVPDDFGDAKWSLEAGALVLANKGTACIDEIDKVDEDALSSLHDALESQRVNVNKAGINATLPAQTALLAAGNPKHGRFQDYEPIPEQIELGPTLMSRFDLMFMVDDTPDADKDREITEHMLNSRETAAQYTSDHFTVDGDDFEQIAPAIKPEVVRAYIAHARQSCTPTFEDESVKESLIEYFTSLRLANADDEEAAVPVTFRKLEGIQRLAEASARVRLSEEITEADVERAVGLVSTSMRQVGFDEEAGTFDADIVETGESSTQRQRKQLVKETILGLQAESDGEPPDVDQSVLLAHLESEEGVSREKVRHDIEEWANDGTIYRPRDGHIRWVDG